MKSVLLALAGLKSTVKPDETVVFFPTYGYLDAARDEWVLNIHGWIFELEEDSRIRRRVLDLFRRSMELDEGAAASAIFKKRAQPFLADNERSKQLSIRLGETEHRLEKSAANGHFSGVVRISRAQATALLASQRARNNWLEYHAVLPEKDKRKFTGRIQLIAGSGLSVVSDVDDTVKITQVTNKAELLANTFLREMRAVPGTPELFQAWNKNGAAFHYVSASPWQLFEPLDALVASSGLPLGTFHLKSFRWKDRSFFSLFSSPEKYKPPVIEEILQTFPGRRFVLVGDSGEKDPEVYGPLARKYAGQVVLIVIRDVTGESEQAARYRKVFEGIPRNRWRIVRTTDEIKQLRDQTDAWR